MAVSGTALFFDDVRQEVGDKLSLMGWYSGEMLVPGGQPVVLRGLGVVGLVSWPLARPPQSLQLEVTLPDGKRQDLAIQPAALVVPDHLRLPDARVARVNAIMMIHTLLVAPGQRITVALRVNGSRRTQRIGVLRIVAAPDPPEPARLIPPA